MCGKLSASASGMRIAGLNLIEVVVRDGDIECSFMGVVRVTIDRSFVFGEVTTRP